MTNKIIDTMWDETPINITQEANFIWSIANKLRGSYMPDKYGDVIIPMTVIRRFECALAKPSLRWWRNIRRIRVFRPKLSAVFPGFRFIARANMTLRSCAMSRISLRGTLSRM